MKRMQSAEKLPAAPWGNLPARMHVLFITGAGRTGAWLAEALAVDSASDVRLAEAAGIACGLQRLRDDLFDAVLISHEEPSLDALEVIDAIRAGSSEEQPIIVLGENSEQEMADLCFECGADVYVCVPTTTTRALIWKIARAVERHELLAENRRLNQDARHRLRREHEEAARLLHQQRTLVTARVPAGSTADLSAIRSAALSTLAAPTASQTPRLPAELVSHYRELLRAYVIMGSGNLAQEMTQLAERLVALEASTAHAMLLHLEVLEEMIGGLGNRGARHVIHRADLLILEVMMNLAESYRQRDWATKLPLRQPLLPGFDAAAY